MGLLVTCRNSIRVWRVGFIPTKRNCGTRTARVDTTGVDDAGLFFFGCFLDAGKSIFVFGFVVRDWSLGAWEAARDRSTQCASEAESDSKYASSVSSSVRPVPVR